MTENEAILIMDGSTRDDHLYMYDAEDRPYLIARAENIALNALKEIQAYRAIGTVEEFKALKEKNEPKKPEYVDTRFRNHGRHIGDGASLDKCYKCPNCNSHIFHVFVSETHCVHCGQKFDWD